MKATKNLVHFAVLGLWGILGVVLVLRVFTGTLGLGLGLGYWLWLAGFAALTSAGVSRVESPVGALGVHAATLFLLTLLPQHSLIGFLRLGIDLLRGS